MRYALLTLLLAGTVAALSGAGKDIRAQSPEELAKTAADLEQAVTAQPGNVDLHIKLGFAYTRLGKADDAQRAFERAVQLDPNRAIAHYMLGLVYEKKGMKDRAIAAWKACLETAKEQRLKDTAIKHLNNLSSK